MNIYDYNKTVAAIVLSHFMRSHTIWIAFLDFINYVA